MGQTRMDRGRAGLMDEEVGQRWMDGKACRRDAQIERWDTEMDERTGGTDGKVEQRDRQTKRRVGKMDGWTHVWRPTDEKTGG